MKSLLISLMAFLCVLGINATPTGSGTQEDPYVIADGDVYMVDDPVYELYGSWRWYLNIVILFNERSRVYCSWR